MPYQTAGSLLLDFPGHQACSKFYRDLNLETAVATVRYVVDGVRYEREMFTSFPDQVAVVRLTASERRRISFRTSFATPMDNYRVTASGDNRLLIDGRVLSVGCEEKALFPAESRPHRGLPSVDRTGIARFGNERSGR